MGDVKGRGIADRGNDGAYAAKALDIAKKYKKIEEVKKGICDKIDQLVKTKISIIS